MLGSEKVMQMDIQFAIYALRRSYGGFDCESGRIVRTAASASEVPDPILDAVHGHTDLRNRIYAAAESIVRTRVGCNRVELHLPILDRAAARDPAAALLNAEVSITPWRQIVVYRPEKRYDPAAYLLTLTGHFLSRGQPLTFEGGYALARWFEAPHEQDTRFKRVYFHVSRRVQTALREWLPRLWFKDDSAYSVLAHSRAMLLYAASGVYVGSNRTDLSHEVLSAPAMRHFYYTCRRGIVPLMIRAYTHLRGCNPKLARQYDPDTIDHMIAWQRRHRSFVESILMSENKVVDAFVHLALNATAVAHQFHLGSAIAGDLAYLEIGRAHV